MTAKGGSRGTGYRADPGGSSAAAASKKRAGGLGSSKATGGGAGGAASGRSGRGTGAGGTSSAAGDKATGAAGGKASTATKGGLVRRSQLDFSLRDLRLEKTVGTGTFGRVRVVFHRRKKKYYALKILKKSEVIRLKQVDHIRNEIRIMSCVDHPFVVNLVGFMQDRKRIYMLLEYVPGGELFTHLRAVEKFSSDAAKFYSAEIALAFEYLHSFDVIYRDLKVRESVCLATDGPPALDLAHHHPHGLCGQQLYSRVCRPPVSLDQLLLPATPLHPHDAAREPAHQQTRAHQDHRLWVCQGR